MAQISWAIEDLVDVEVHLEQPAKEGSESPEEWFPKGVLFDSLLGQIEFEAWIHFMDGVLLLI